MFNSICTNAFTMKTCAFHTNRIELWSCQLNSSTSSRTLSINRKTKYDFLVSRTSLCLNCACGWIVSTFNVKMPTFCSFVGKTKRKKELEIQTTECWHANSAFERPKRVLYESFVLHKPLLHILCWQSFPFVIHFFFQKENIKNSWTISRSRNEINVQLIHFKSVNSKMGTGSPNRQPNPSQAYCVYVSFW